MSFLLAIKKWVKSILKKMGFEELLKKLEENPREESIEAARLLIKIADNIINHPKNVKIRTINKSNPTISKKILQVQGGLMCLKLMGFQESETCFFLPAEAKLTSISNGKDALCMWKESVEHLESNADPKANAEKPSSSMRNYSKIEKASGSSIDLSKNFALSQTPVSRQEIIKPIVLPPLKLLYSVPFFRKIEQQFHNCLRYANKDVQERARKLIPIVTLEHSAQERLRAIQQHIKRNNLVEPDISIQDMLILELLQWFKEDFFSWVDSPICKDCGGKTNFSHMATDSKLMIYTNRVELHRCETCHNFTPFARYEDLNILLETRNGRCGEWANVFTLFCYAMGWDARFVLDENDHVWTEVYSIAQNRWLHCDPCENICDKPLIYESGWKKAMTYVIAYSPEEVQDVTWRYSSHHREVLRRRKLCDEKRLVDVLIELREKRQMSFSPSRKAYLTKRLILELADMMTEKKPGDEENKGRESGNAVWRLARGEIEDEVPTEFIWKIDPASFVDNKVSLRYSAANDTYELLTDGVVLNSVRKWTAGCFKYQNIIRKEERDWKQVYLSRKENDGKGHISWRFEFQRDFNRQLNVIEIQFQHATFENGIVEAKICSNDLCEVIPEDSIMLRTHSFAGKTSVTVEATLSGGKGDVAWQHTQLFRQSLDSSSFPFTIDFILGEKLN